ncbi:hypothetical protein ACIBK9_13640 [Nonomuraea sp. NPDC050227]|uniref:hypothetical protein n=1 Tax=Nonomuraea sp. NPDC050227 TaxID=3364360 RepID=UPI0037A775AE
MNVTPIDLTEGQRKLLIRIRDHTVITGDVNTLWGDWTRRAVFKRLAEQGLIRDERDDLANGYRWHVTDAGRAVLDQIAEVKRARAIGRRLTPRRLEFMSKLAEHGSLVLYDSYEDIPEYGLNQPDVDALVALGFIDVGEPSGHHGTARKTVLTDAGRAELERRGTGEHRR